MKMKWIWICVALVGAVIAAVLWSKGEGGWALAVAALLLVCPILAIWVGTGGLERLSFPPRRRP